MKEQGEAELQRTRADRKEPRQGAGDGAQPAEGLPSTHEAQHCTKAVVVPACNHSPGEAGTGGVTGKSQVILGYQTSWRPIRDQGDWSSAVLTLDISGLNAPIERKSLTDWIKNTGFYQGLAAQDSLWIQGLHADSIPDTK